jgi:hypothetical protein
MSKRETRTHRGEADGKQSSEYRVEMHKNVKPGSGEWIGRYVAQHPQTSDVRALTKAKKKK